MAICVDIVPTPCGGTNKLTMKDVCNDVHFTGIEDTTINQGVGIDLTEGIHAYDGNGNEIEYTVTPDSIDKCDVGEHTVVYRTIGEGDKFLPSFCMDNVDVTLGDTFCNEILLEEDRIVTITQADPPTIEGIETIPTIYPNEEFDPTEGITAVDDNGKTIDFTYSGRVEDSSEGAIASFETEFEQNALSVVADIEPIQDGEPWISALNTEPYQFRQVPTQSHEFGYEIDKLVGGTVAWNQACARIQRVRSTLSSTYNGTSDIVCTSGGSAKTFGFFPRTESNSDYIYIENHIYFVSVNIKSFSVDGFKWFYCESSLGSVTPYFTTTGIFGFICKPTSSSAKSILCSSDNTTTTNDTFTFNSVQVFDLTQMFGSTIADYIYSLEQATEGAGVAWFRKLFPKPYYAYNAGELLSVSGVSAHNMTGFNQWDEEWELGALSATGGNATSSTEIRSKNYIPVVGGQTYYLYCAVASTFNYRFYDADKNFISGAYISRNNTLLIPNDARYMRFYMGAAYGTTYNHDICINLSWDGERNGEYEPYAKHSYALDDSLTLRGIPKLDSSNNLYYDGDTYESDGTVTRKYGIVDLGSLSWSVNGSRMQATLSDTISGFSYNLVCAKYITDEAIASTNPTKDKVIGRYQNRVLIYDSAYSDATAFKTAMSGVYLVYELATPTTETAEPYTSPQIVDRYGTEEYVSTSIVPIGHSTSYANICPISGHDEVNVSVCGKNLWNPTIYDGGAYNPTVGAVWNLTESATQFTQEGDTFSLTTSATWRYYTILFEIKDASLSYYRNVTFTANATGGTTEVYLDKDFTVLWRSNSTDTTQTKSGVLSIPSGAKYYALVITNRGTASATLSLKAPQIELGTTATSYEPYNGTTYEVSFGTAGTVYGGTVDVVSGALTVTHELRTFDGSSSEFWNDYTSGLGGYYIYVANHKTERYGDGWCNVFPTSRSASTEGVIYGINSKYIFFIGSHSIAETVADWRTWLASNPLQVVYELAEPQRYPLTAQEVELLLGENNVWADTGDIKVIYEKEMPASGNIEYLTAGFKIITYTATDECGNQTVEQRIVYVLGDTPQVCMAEVCTAHTACVVSKICSSEICTAQCS